MGEQLTIEHLIAVYTFSKKEWQVLSRVVLILLAFAVTYPLLTYTWSLKGVHDLAFHLARIRSLATGLKAGVLPVRLYASQAFNFGYPCGVCYPDLFLYFPAALICLGFSEKFAYIIFVFVVNLATAAIAYVSFGRIFRSDKVGLIGAVLWTLAPYRITDVLLRAAVGEYVALAFGPLILLGLWSIFLDEQGAPGTGWVTLGIAMAGVVHSHILSVMLFGVWGAILLVPLAIWRRKRRVIIALVKSLVLALLLSASFVVPFLDYYLSHDLLARHAGNTAAAHATVLAQLLAPFLRMSGVSRSLEMSLDGEMPLGLGWGLLGALPLAMILILQPSFIKGKRKDVRRWLIATVAIALLFTVVCTYHFPWDYSGSSLFLNKIIRILKYAQFPWRFMGLVTLTLALLGCMVARAIDRRVCVGVAMCLLLTVIECGYATSSFVQNANQTNVDAYSNAGPNIGNGEYLSRPLTPRFADDWPDGEFRPSSDAGGLVVTSFERVTPQATSVALANSSDKVGKVRLPLFWHKENVLVEKKTGSSPTGISIGNDHGYVSLTVEPGYEGMCTMEFREPVLWRVAEVTSLATVALLTVWAVRTHKKA